MKTKTELAAEMGVSSQTFSRRTEKEYFLKSAWQNARTRIRIYEAYKGIGLMELYDFIEFGMNSAAFHNLWDNWVDSGWDRKFTPSPDRIHADGDYSVENIQWVTNSENCKKAADDKKRERKPRSFSPIPKGGMGYKVLDLQTGVFYDSIRKAAIAKDISYNYLYGRLKGSVENDSGMELV